MTSKPLSLKFKPISRGFEGVKFLPAGAMNLSGWLILKGGAAAGN